MPNAPAAGCDSRKDMHFMKQSSGTMVSGFKNRIYFPLATDKAMLFALAKPTFFPFHINLTALNFSLKKLLLPSDELLSTTKISASISLTALVTEHRHCSKKNF